MKAASFAYEAPRTVADALTILSQHEDGRVLAGGQTLVPMMAFRMARPSVLVDINKLAEVDYCEVRNSFLCIGALTRHEKFHNAVVDGALGELLAAVVKHIAHPPIRTRGTFCGSVAHADPSSEWCLVSATLDATVVLASVAGRREVAAHEFFLGLLSTAIQAGEMIVEVRLPLLSRDTKFGFSEFSRRAGDFALAMALAVVRVEKDKVIEVRVGLGGVETLPRRICETERILSDCVPSLDLVREAAEVAATSVDPLEDIQADIPLRRDLTRAVIERALKQALSL